jgi:hypothetical protein
MKPLSIRLSNWQKMSIADRDAKISATQYTNIVANGKPVLHVGNGVADGIGPAPEPTTLDDVYAVTQANRTHLQAVSKELADFIAKARQDEAVFSAMTPAQRRAAGVQDSDLEAIREAITQFDNNNTQAIAALEAQVRKLSDEAKAVMASAAAQFDGFDAADIKAAAKTLDPKELKTLLKELRNEQIAAMAPWEYFLHISVNYVLPVLVLVCVAVVSALTAGVGAFALGRWTAPDASADLEIGLDAADSVGGAGDYTGVGVVGMA